MLNVAVDFQSVQGQKTGIGVFAQSLLEEIKNTPSDVRLHFLSRNSGKDLNAPGRLAWENIEIPRRLRQIRADVMYSPGFSPPFWASCPRVVTVHDIIGKLYPANHAGFSRLYWSHWQPAALRRAEKIVASSKFTKKTLVDALGIPEKKIEVLYPGARACFKPAAGVSSQSARPYFLSVGTLEPRKNILGLLRAYRQSGLTEVDLVLAGKPAGAQDEIHRYLRENNLEKRVKIIGYARQAELLSLYQGALAYVTVSFYEGFGYAALEGMGCGLPGVVSNRGSLPEVAGDAALLVNPENTQEMAQAMNQIVKNSNLRRELSKKALERVHFFDIRATARRMLEIFAQAASRK